MRIVEPDFARMIDLPGVGLCPRPVDIDQSVTGFSDLVSLRVYTFAPDMIINGEAEEDELFIVLLRGTVDVDVAGAATKSFSLQTEGGPAAIYLPPHDRYRLHARSEADVAYARGRPKDDNAKMARAFDSEDGRVAVIGYAGSLNIALTTRTFGTDQVLSELCNSPVERLVHIRSADCGVFLVAGQTLHDWQTLALDENQPGEIGEASSSATVLVLAAT